MNRLIDGDWRRIAFPDAGALSGRFQDMWITTLPSGVHSEKANINSSAVFAMPLPCYPRTLLCELETVRNPEHVSIAAFLYGPFGLRLIDGSSAMIHDLNLFDGILLDTPEQAAAYVRFFCSAVHGSQGRFEVIETDAQLSGVPIAGSNRALIGPMTAQPNGKRWQVAGVVRYADALFSATFCVDRDGIIEMEDEEPLEVIDGLITEQFDAPFRLVPFPDSKAEPNP